MGYILLSKSIKSNSVKQSTKQKGNTPAGQLDSAWDSDRERVVPVEKDPYESFPDGKNPETGEIGGPKGPEPTRYGDWERKGRVYDF